MITATKAFTLLISILGLSSQVASAGIIITNFAFTENTLSFEVSGTLPGPFPESSQPGFFFVNQDLAADPGFSFGDINLASSFSFTGSQALSSVGTGLQSEGDHFFVRFVEEPAVGEAFSGIVTATWDQPIFDPSLVVMLDVYWGKNSGLPGDPTVSPSTLTGGTYLTTIAVPEPSAPLLLIGGLSLVALMSRKRLRQPER